MWHIGDITRKGFMYIRIYKNLIEITAYDNSSIMTYQKKLELNRNERKDCCDFANDFSTTHPEIGIFVYIFESNYDDIFS